MKKTIIILAVLIVLLAGGIVFADKYGQKKNNTIAGGGKTTATPREARTGASASVGHIDFQATVETKQNFNALNAEFGGKLDKPALNSSTQIVLIMNNHRDDLSAFDYKKLSTLNGVAANNWRQLDNQMGGHHVKGVLIFPKTENPQSLVIKGLPVGEVVLTF